MPTRLARRDSAPPSGDGRKRRSHDSQQRIVGAMLELVGEGVLSPSAEEVSARAGVGLRSVFRHFKDMERLHEAMAEVLSAKLADVARRPFVATDWRGQVLELIDRRAAAYERMGPYLRAGRVQRHRSSVLRARHAAFVAQLRHILEERLPEEALASGVSIEAVDLLLSFEAWQRLRDDQRLSVARAKAVLRHAMTCLIGSARVP